MSKKAVWAIVAGAIAIGALVFAGFALTHERPGPVQDPDFVAGLPADLTVQAAAAEAAARAWVTFDLDETSDERVERLLHTFASTDGLQGYATSAHRRWWSREDVDIKVRVLDVDAVAPVGESGSGWIFSVFLTHETTVTQFGQAQTTTDRGEFWVYVPKTGDPRAALIQER